MHLVLTTALAVALALLSVSAAIAAPTQVVEGEKHCVVNVKSSDALNVRAKASASSKIVTTHRYGDCGTIVTGTCQGSWCSVEDAITPAGSTAGTSPWSRLPATV